MVAQLATIPPVSEANIVPTVIWSADPEVAHEQHPGDTFMLRRLLAGDEAAFNQLVDQYHGPLLRLARVYVGDRHVAEEVVQETWMAVIKGLKAFEGRSSLKTWIFRILSNRAKSRGVREGRTIPFSALAGEQGDGDRTIDSTLLGSGGQWRTPVRSWEADTPERLISDRETRHFIEKAIENLPAKQRAVVSLRDVEGWQSDEVCKLLEISETYQRVLLHRGRSKLRLEIDRHLGA